MGEQLWLVPAFFVIALLYASVGHGGGSGYLAMLSFLPATMGEGQAGVAVRPDEMATTALTLNLAVSTVAFLRFARAGHFNAQLAWPFLAASVPMAFLGGAFPVPLLFYRRLLAAALVAAAIRLGMTVRGRDELSYTKPSLALALPVGGGIGWLSGAVGIGGGVFLSPLVLLCRWASPKHVAAVSAAFILVNSAAGLGGRAVRSGLAYGSLWPLLAAALLGGWTGAHLGANHFSGHTIKRLLAMVLLIAAAKLVLT